MDLDWDPDQIAFRSSVVDFARKELPVTEGFFSRQTWQKCASFGIQGLMAPTEYGGQGADALTTMLAMEALGYGSHDNGLIFSLNAHIWSAVSPVARFGNPEQKDRYLSGLCDGTLIGVQGMTEPDSGSDAFALRTRAVEKGDSFVLTGTKTFITNAPVADVFVIFATTDPELGAFGLAAFIVDRDSAGLTVGQPFKKMGLNSSPMSELFLDEVPVPRANLLGRMGNGMTIFNHSIDWERAGVLASAVGTMERQIEASCEHARNRHTFGRPIASNQAVSHRLVDMQVRLEAARLLLYKAGWAKTHKGELAPYESAMAKLFISEAWVQNSLDTLQIHGASGYMVETGIEQDVRDSIASRIYSGTSEIQKNIIAREMGL